MSATAEVLTLGRRVPSIHSGKGAVNRSTGSCIPPDRRDLRTSIRTDHPVVWPLDAGLLPRLTCPRRVAVDEGRGSVRRGSAVTRHHMPWAGAVEDAHLALAGRASPVPVGRQPGHPASARVARISARRTCPRRARVAGRSGGAAVRSRGMAGSGCEVLWRGDCWGPPRARVQWVWRSSASGVGAIMFTVRPASRKVSMLSTVVPVSRSMTEIDPSLMPSILASPFCT